MSTFRVVFMGTPDFAVPTLQALIEGPDEVVGVFTNPDRRSGRGKKATPPPVKVAAEAAGIPVYQPASAKTPDFAAALTELSPDLAVVVAYGQILPQRVLDIPRLGCVNVHASLLPKLRGAAPINWAIVRAHSETGVSIMKMEAGLDSGPVYAAHRLEILPGETAGALHDRLTTFGARALMETMQALRDGDAHAVAQDHSQMTYAPMMKKSDGEIDWAQPAQAVVKHILGFNPWPGAYTNVAQTSAERFCGARIKLHLAEVWEGGDGAEAAAPGTIVSDVGQRGPLLVSCGDGIVRIIRCQAPARRAMDAEDFLRGCPLPVGTRLGPA